MTAEYDRLIMTNPPWSVERHDRAPTTMTESKTNTSATQMDLSRRVGLAAVQ